MEYLEIMYGNVYEFICNQLSLVEWIGLVLFIIGIVFSNQIHDFFVEKILKRPLKIQPSQKLVVSSKNDDGWNEEFFVYLTNRTNQTYYDINISAMFPNSVDVDLLPTNPSGVVDIKTSTGAISKGADFIIGTGDKYGRTKSSLTVINNVGPQETKKIKVIVNKQNLDKNFNLVFKINNFSDTPKSIFIK